MSQRVSSKKEVNEMITLGILLLRAVAGLTIAAHGAQKIFGWFGGPGMPGFIGMVRGLGIKPARFWAYAVAVVEFLGGLLVALGLLTPIAAIAVFADMVVAIVLVHVAKGFFNQSGGYEFPLLMAVVMLTLALTGPGAASLDGLIRMHLPQPMTLVASLAVFLGGAVAALESRRISGGSRRQSQAA
jgi:putative oxidoreductase